MGIIRSVPNVIERLAPSPFFLGSEIFRSFIWSKAKSSVIICFSSCGLQKMKNNSQPVMGKVRWHDRSRVQKHQPPQLDAKMSYKGHFLRSKSPLFNSIGLETIQIKNLTAALHREMELLTGGSLSTFPTVHTVHSKVQQK